MGITIDNCQGMWIGNKVSTDINFYTSRCVNSIEDVNLNVDSGCLLVNNLTRRVNQEVNVMPFSDLVKGPCGRIVSWGKTKAEASAGVRNIPDITEQEKRKLVNLFATFTETGKMNKSDQKFKAIEKQADLFEFKAHQLRLLGTFLEKDVFGICHYVRKKKNKHRPQDLDLAQKNKGKMKKEWENGHS